MSTCFYGKVVLTEPVPGQDVPLLPISDRDNRDDIVSIFGAWYIFILLWVVFWIAQWSKHSSITWLISFVDWGLIHSVSRSRADLQCTLSGMLSLTFMLSHKSRRYIMLHHAVLVFMFVHDCVDYESALIHVWEAELHQAWWVVVFPIGLVSLSTHWCRG